ncbi:MAG: bifunctional precorrin-2 dehydrogenase/sirohydrochlorin ferrochelatase [Planctomycetes bacterium]|nr:bifunctional precorrin-2 dehydrogenase/sirohydrochlorin ferrochelatase [Planctomycetota bacterium]
MSKYPINLDLAGKPVTVIGAGSVGARKIRALCDAGAKVTVVSKNFASDFDNICKGLDIEVIEGVYKTQHIENAVLAIAATDDRALNEQIYKDCRNAKVLCNIVDVPDLCDFYVPAVVKRGDLQIAIGTDGKCPAYSGRIRRKLEDIFTEDHGKFLDELAIAREKTIANTPPKVRMPILKKLSEDESYEYFLKNGSENWQKKADKTIKSWPTE